jgi:uncharacterized protein YuzB (UPF0349 family)
MTEELGNLKILAVTLDKKLKMTEFDLIRFCDAYKQHLFTMGSSANVNHETEQTIANEVIAVSALLAEFDSFKTKINIRLSSISKR